MELPMPIIRIFDLGVIVIFFILAISVNAVYATVGLENNGSSSSISNNNINSSNSSISNSSNNSTSAQ